MNTQLKVGDIVSGKYGAKRFARYEVKEIVGGEFVRLFPKPTGTHRELLRADDYVKVI